MFGSDRRRVGGCRRCGLVDLWELVLSVVVGRREMIGWVLLALLWVRGWSGVALGEETWWRERVVSSWCGLGSVGVGYSHGGEFACPKEDGDGWKHGDSLEGTTLRIGVIEGDDFEYDCGSSVTKGRREAKDSYSGFIVGMLQDVLRFEVELVGSLSWGYYRDDNSTWQGLAGLLAANATDLTGCHWTTTEHLLELADFLLCTLETTQSFVYLPQNVPLMADVFVEALSRRLWVFFLLSIFSLMMFFWFSTYVHSRVRPDHEPWSWDEVVLWAVAAVSQQSYSRHPRGASCRTMFLIGYTITYLLYTGFAAGITSLLALKSHQNHLTLDEVAQMKLRLLLLREEYNPDVFDERSRFAYLNLRQGHGDSLQQIFEKIKQPNFLAYGSTTTLLNYLSRKIHSDDDSANFVVVPTPHSTRRKAFLVQKSFPYKRLFNYWLLRLRETGFLDLGKRRYLTPKDSANLKPPKWFSAGLENVFSAVTFLILGWILSACVLLAEILREKKINRE